MRKSFERTLERRSDLISNENYKKSPQSKRIIKENNQFMKFRIGNGYDMEDLEEDWFWDM